VWGTARAAEDTACALRAQLEEANARSREAYRVGQAAQAAAAEAMADAAAALARARSADSAAAAAVAEE
jgi:hypothetical protein